MLKIECKTIIRIFLLYILNFDNFLSNPRFCASAFVKRYPRLCCLGHWKVVTLLPVLLDLFIACTEFTYGMKRVQETVQFHKTNILKTVQSSDAMNTESCRKFH